MRSLRARLVLSHLLPILLIAPLIGLSLIYLLETQVLLTGLSESIRAEAVLIAEALNPQPEIWENAEQANAFVARVSLNLDGQIFLVRPDGTLLSASSPPTEAPLDPAALQAALQGEPSVVVTYGLLEQQVVAFVPVSDINQGLTGIVGVSQRIEGIASQFARLRWLVLGVLGLAVLLASLAGILLSRRLERPITRVAGAVIDIAEGRPVRPLPQEGPEEIRRLAGAVNTLAERLRILEDTRRQSLANIVHELGRPLGAIRAAIHTLQTGAGEDPAVRQELLSGIEREIERLQPLLDDLAQLHGQVSGQLSLDRQAVALSDWLPPLVLPWRAAAREKGLGWEASIPADLPTVEIDPDRMAQALGNLLSNAVKYTPEGGQVAVLAKAPGDTVEIQVRDSGPGIMPEEEERIFEPFFRSTQERRFPQGLGLGLTIARDLVEHHGGTLTVESEPGEGSVFTVRLPGA